MPYSSIDLSKVKTYPIARRQNLVKLADLIHPENELPLMVNEDLDKVIDAILNARREGRPVIWSMGAHVIKCGLGPLMIDLMEKGVITHLAGNGAVSIHDTELALIGETSEDVAMSIEDGSFGMAYETGHVIYRALRQGVMDGLGYGESLGRLISDEKMPHREISVLYNAYRLKIPMTIHATVGADIIHQHPESDFGVLGEATGRDFKIFCASVAELDHGVFLNFGSAVTGAEVFLKALSIARNLGYPVSHFTTANFDLVPLAGNYHTKVGKDVPEYYYRPRKNIVNRPVSMGGQGYHIQGDHMVTIPTIHHKLTTHSDLHVKVEAKPLENVDAFTGMVERLTVESPRNIELLQNLADGHPDLREAAIVLSSAFLATARSLSLGGTLYVSGNGGSMSDALHISGELLKSYAAPRPLTTEEAAALHDLPDEEKLGHSLERGLRAVTLGVNPVISSAVDNDFAERSMAVAQELNALGRPGDVFLAISTSGKARNLLYAAETARAKGITAILLTGPNTSPLSKAVDLAIHAPGARTDRIQENHILLYHCYCEMLERHFFMQ